MISPTNYKLQAANYQNGQAVLVSVIFLVLLSVVIIAGFVTPLTRELKSVRVSANSRQSYFAAEAGVEDAAYRLKNSLAYTSPYNLTVGLGATVITIGSSGNTRTIDSLGNVQNHQRKLSAQLDLSSVGGQFIYGIQVGEHGLEMGNGTRVEGSSGNAGSVYSDGNIVCQHGTCTVTGDAIVAGGLNDTPSDFVDDDNDDQFFSTNINNQDIAQSFGSSVGGALNKVSLYLAKVGNPSSNLTLRIRTDNGGKPSTAGADLASATILTSLVGATASWIDVAFSSPPSLTGNTTYWIVLDTSSYSSANYWNWRRFNSGIVWLFPRAEAAINHNAKYTRDWTTTSWSGILSSNLLFKVWVGGTSTKIEGLTIGDTGHANVFVNTTCGTACIIDNQPIVPLPISDGVVQDWRDKAALGDPIIGNYLITNSTSIGPKKIVGNLTVNIPNSAIVTITGTLWVTGNITFSCSNGSKITLSSGYGTDSGVIVGDGTITVGNNCTFTGSGQSDSYLMILSAKNAPTEIVMTVNNNSNGVIYYAGHGLIELSQNAAAKEVTAYGIDMEENSTITYESGLSNLNFSSGPGGSFDITKWQETE